MGVPAITKIDVAPVSAMVCVSANVSTLGTPCCRAEAMFLVREVFDVKKVASSLLFTVVLLGSNAKFEVSLLHL
jgi:hypothetical protein